jgi:hypothetical protein
MFSLCIIKHNALNSCGGVKVQFQTFLGTFAKLQKATGSFIMSVCPSIHMEQFGFHWTDFDKIWYLRFFQKSVKKIQVSLKSDKNNRYFT